MSRFLFIAVVSYLFGSIPFGYLLVRVFRGEDVRLSGSGNIGATNVSRKSPALGVLTLLLDAAKGWLAVEFAVKFCIMGHDDLHLAQIMAASALFAIVGHMFPIWLRFRGGKGSPPRSGRFFVSRLSQSWLRLSSFSWSSSCLAASRLARSWPPQFFRLRSGP